MLKPEVRLALEFTAGLVLAAVAMSSLDLGINFATFLGLVLALVFTVVCELLWVKKETAAEAYITFKGDDTVLLKARRPENASVIKIQEVLDHTMVYHEPELVYTGVTVGNVHTGGFHKEGDYYEDKVAGTQKYYLAYRSVSVNNLFLIRKIKLDNEALIEEARRHPVVSRYLQKDGTLLLENKVADKYGADSMELLLKNNQADAAMKLAKFNYYDKQLTKQECKEIQQWLIGPKKAVAFGGGTYGEKAEKQLPVVLALIAGWCVWDIIKGNWTLALMHLALAAVLGFVIYAKRKK